MQVNTNFPLANDLIYIATFYSHFGAIRFKRLCDKEQIPAKCMPVPRNLSSSCGTCVRCTGGLPDGEPFDEMEQIVIARTDGYEVIYRAADS